MRNRHLTIANDLNWNIPPSFISRLGTLEDKLDPEISDYEVIVLHGRAPSEGHSVLVPLKFGRIPFSKLTGADKSLRLTIHTYHPKDEN